MLDDRDGIKHKEFWDFVKSLGKYSDDVCPHADLQPGDFLLEVAYDRPIYVWGYNQKTDQYILCTIDWLMFGWASNHTNLLATHRHTIPMSYKYIWTSGYKKDARTMAYKLIYGGKNK